MQVAAQIFIIGSYWREKHFTDLTVPPQKTPSSSNKQEEVKIFLSFCANTTPAHQSGFKKETPQ